MSKQKYFSSYKSPNICIVPGASIRYPPSPKRPKLEMPVRDNSPQNIDVSFLDDLDIDEIVKCLNDCDDTQNTTRKIIVENSNDNLEIGCPKSSLTENNNERNVLYTYTERDLLTKSIDNKETDIVIEKTHNKIDANFTCIDKDVKASSTNYDKHKHADVYIDKENNEIIVPSPIIEQLNAKTYNAIDDDDNASNDTPNNVNSSETITNCLDSNNSQELLKENIIKKCLLQAEKDLASANKASKSFDGNTEDKIGSDTIMNTNNDNIKCKETKENPQYSDDSELQNKNNTTTTLKVEKMNNKLNTNEILKNNQLQRNEVSNSFKSENSKKNDISQAINNEKRIEIREATKNKEEVLIENVNNPKSIIFNNLEKVMLHSLHKKYSMFSLIHSGKFSNIFKCSDSGDKQYAVKILKKKGNGYRKENMWSGIQGDIPKENLLCVYLIAGFSFNSYWCYLTDFYPKNLKEVLKESENNLHIDTIQELAGQLVGAVTTLRNKNIVHSDINPCHILLDCTNSKLRLCGFDSAYHIDAANLFPYKGTKCYRAPEVILGYSAGFSLDVWSTALVLHEMATGIQLFGGCFNDHLLYKQMCILGDVPPQMLLRSLYKNKYIIGYCFQNNKCSRHNPFSKVKGKNKIASTIQGAYFSHWTAGKNQKQISKELKKIREFTRLLQQMLVIYPERRLPIEFAYSNPFIYRVFNN